MICSMNIRSTYDGQSCGTGKTDIANRYRRSSHFDERPELPEKVSPRNISRTAGNFSNISLGTSARYISKCLRYIRNLKFFLLMYQQNRAVIEYAFAEEKKASTSRIRSLLYVPCLKRQANYFCRRATGEEYHL